MSLTRHAGSRATAAHGTSSLHGFEFRSMQLMLVSLSVAYIPASCRAWVSLGFVRFPHLYITLTAVV